VGVPRELGGIPLDGIGTTGFGTVGRHSALLLAKKGVRIVGVADSKSAIAEQDGLDLERS
jgi:glutamate dehydrogenase (NAD(P)+)